MMTLQLSVLQLHLDDKRSLIILGLSHLGLHMIRKQRSFRNDSWSVSPISIIQGYTISWWPYFKNFTSNYFLFLLIGLFVSVIVDVDLWFDEVLFYVERLKKILCHLFCFIISKDFKRYCVRPFHKTRQLYYFVVFHIFKSFLF